MKQLAAIQALYLEIDAAFEDQRRAVANAMQARPIEEKQKLNDQAWFVLGWGQLETAIDEACRQAIRMRKSGANRETRRVWELFNPDERRLSGLSFENRVALVLDRERGVDCGFRKIMRYYNTRNQIAHGALLTSRIDVTKVFKDFYEIQSELET